MVFRRAAVLGVAVVAMALAGGPAHAAPAQGAAITPGVGHVTLVPGREPFRLRD